MQFDQEPDESWGVGFPPPDTPPVVVGEQPVDHRSSFPGAWVTVVVVTLILVGGLAFLLTSVLGSDTATGASSPEAALEGLVQAANDEDALGVASLIDLEEFGLLADTLDDVDSDVSALSGGLDLVVTGGGDDPVTATFDELGGPESGLVVAAVDGLEFVLTRTDTPPWGVVLFDDQALTVLSTGEIDPGSEVQLAMRPAGDGFTVAASGRINDERLDSVEERVEDVPMEIVFIENDGRWYLSLGYTVVNLAVSAGAVDEPAYGAWRAVLEDESSGADTPTGAVERVVDAVSALDLESGVLAVDPVETKILHDFMPLILEATEAERLDALDDARIEVTGLELSEEVDGDTARVYLDRVALKITESGGDTAELALDGDWCYRFEDPYETTSGCLPDDLAEVQDEVERQLTISGLDLGADLTDALPDRPFVVTTKRDGNWYVSPLATMFGYAADLEAWSTGAVGQAETDVGFDSATPLVVGGTTTVEVEPGGFTALTVSPTADQFDDELGADLAFLAVRLTSDTAVEVQHDVEIPDAPGAPNTVRIDDDEPTLLIASSENVFPRSRALLLRNEGDTAATVAVDVQLMPFEMLGPGGVLTGSIDELGTPWFVSADGRVSIEGAEMEELTFDRFPWFEVTDPTTATLDAPLAFVVGEPGAEFTLTAE